MADGLLRLESWDEATEAAQLRLARSLHERVSPVVEFVGLRTFAQGDQRHRVAFFEHAGSKFALVPGGDVTLGFDPSRFQPSKAQVESYRQITARFSGVPSDVREYIVRVSTPLRTCSIKPLLVEVQPREIGVEEVSPDEPDLAEYRKKHRRLFRHPLHTVEVHNHFRISRVGQKGWKAWRIVRTTHADLSAKISAEGMRLLTSDEWEHSCSAGSRALFRWGDDCPCDRYPSRGGDLDQGKAARSRVSTPRRLRADSPRWNEHRRPSAFGLTIAHNPYDNEMVVEGIWRGGDGGWAIHGGLAFFMGWLPLATSFLSHFPDAISEDKEDANLSTGRVRRVIPIDGG